MFFRKKNIEFIYMASHNIYWENVNYNLSVTTKAFSSVEKVGGLPVGWGVADYIGVQFNISNFVL